jgi:hypothetical protein
MKPNEKNKTSIRQPSVVPSLPKRVWNSLSNFLVKLDEFATNSRRTDEQIRKIRSENYGKYGFYFRDRF